MAKAYYSTVFEHPADDIWKIIRDFNNYPVWVGGAGESRIEHDKSGDTVGAVRNVLYQGSGYASGSWRNPMSSGRRPTSSVMRPRCRSRTSGPRCGLHLSSMVIAPSWNGGQRSIANRFASANSLKHCGSGLGNGSSHCVSRWRPKGPSSPLLPIQTLDSAISDQYCQNSSDIRRLIYFRSVVADCCIRGPHLA